jgi:hypothetical protein
MPIPRVAISLMAQILDSNPIPGSDCLINTKRLGSIGTGAILRPIKCVVSLALALAPALVLVLVELWKKLEGYFYMSQAQQNKNNAYRGKEQAALLHEGSFWYVLFIGNN